MTSKAMIRPLFHSYLLPPHCSASSRQENRRTREIELLKLLFPGSLDLLSPPLDVQEGDDESSGQCTEGQVN
jgi:hypothetical protein